MLTLLANALVFLVGLTGFIALVFGLSYWSLPASMVVGGLLAMWWSWYISIGARLQLTRHAAHGER